MAFNLIKNFMIASTIISPSLLAGAPIETGAGKVSKYIVVPGKVGTNPNKTAHVSPRYEGMVKKVFFKAGDVVRKGANLATIEQNNVVSRYNITSPISGTILHRDINSGDFVNEDQKAFRISDLKTVWVNFEVRPQMIAAFKKGKSIIIHSRSHNEDEISGRIFYIAPTVDESTRTIRVSVEIENKGRDWAPGKLVEGHLFEKNVDIPHVVPVSHLHQEGKKFFAFVKEGDSVRKIQVRIGIRDKKFAEVLAGLSVGSTVFEDAPEDIHDSHDDNEDEHGHEHGEHEH